jgi:hypothetical protein
MTTVKGVNADNIRIKSAYAHLSTEGAL